MFSLKKNYYLIIESIKDFDISTIKKRNKFAQDLYTKKYKSKTIKPKKGKGSFKRIKIKK